MKGSASIAAIVWEPVFPPFLILLAGLLLGYVAVRFYLRTSSRLSARRRVFLMGLRLLAILGICAILFQPMIEESFPRRHPKRVALVAVDSSRSMNEKDDQDQATRLDTARRLLAESGLIGPSDAGGEIGEVRLFHFDATANPLAPRLLPALEATGETTLFHQSITSTMESLRTGEHCIGLFLFSDGHDFELTPSQHTAQLARSRQTAIYPVALGRDQTIPDVSVNIASYQPYTFVKQRAQVQATVRLMGSESRPLRVELLREGVLLRDRTISAEPGYEVPVAFEVSEDKPGQYEYEIRVSPLPTEREIHNNNAFTFLNVTDAKAPVLLIEGAPHWDTTFLRRTLTRNARVELSSAVAMRDGKVSVRSADSRARHIPDSEAEFESFLLVILGRDIDKILSPEACRNLAKAVEDGGATIVFARGKPGVHPVFEELAPAPWSGAATGPVRLVKGRGSGEIVPIEVLASAPGGSEALPELPWAMQTDKPKTLAAVESMAEDTALGNASPAFVHRRHGRGQVLAVAVGGLWKWSLNARSEVSNNVYDRFWNQLLLNLIARSNASPGDDTALSVSSANVALGEKINFTLHTAPGQPPPLSPQVAVFLEDEIVAGVPLARDQDDRTWRGSIVPEKTGRYGASIDVGGRPLKCRFAVYREQRETTEVTPDVPYLRQLARATGGKLLDAASLRETVAGLGRAAAAEADAPPIVRRRSCWDRAVFFYVLFGFLGVEWFLRRRWGMA